MLNDSVELNKYSNDNEILRVVEKIFELSRLHMSECENPNCCLNKVLENLGLEKKSVLN